MKLGCNGGYDCDLTHVLCAAPERPDDAVVGGGHEENRQQDDHRHLVERHEHSPTRYLNVAANLFIKVYDILIFVVVVLQ